MKTMQRAMRNAAAVRGSTSPNPWVGAVVTAPDGARFDGATSPPGGPHAEIVALTAAGERAAGGALTVTLEPCAHHGRTPPCTEAIIAAGIRRVTVAIEDPDALVAGRGIATLRSAGIEVSVGECSDAVRDQLAAYVVHRQTGRPFVVLKLAATLDGRIAATDGSSGWITGLDARTDVHRLRAESDAVVVGAGTVRADDPALTVRHVPGRDPLRVVLGSISPTARVHPCREHTGKLDELLDDLGRDGVVQVLVEGGASVAASFHRAGLVDRYVLYLAPALMGGEDGIPLLRGPGSRSMSSIWTGTFRSVTRIGPDLRIELDPPTGRCPTRRSHEES